MENSLRKDQLLMAQNYALYYGYGNADLMSRFDIAVIEPKGQTLKEINHLKNKNTLVITYLSIIEVRPDDPIFQNLEDDDFLIVDGKRVKNEQYGTYLVNLQSEAWIQYLLREIYHQLIMLGSDGIFLDTIGDIDGYSEDVRDKQLTALVNFLYVIRILYPNYLMIQNNGLEHVCLQTAPFIDGICWENPPLENQDAMEWVDVIKERLIHLSNQYNLKILLLIEETLDKDRRRYLKARKMVKDYGFSLYSAPNNYVEGVNVVKG